LLKGLEYFQKAIEQDPSYALAYAGLADGFLVLSFFDASPAKAFGKRGNAAARKALEICPDLAEALTPLGMTQATVEWNWTDAELNHKRALEVNPNFWLAHTHYAMLLSSMGRHEEAVREVRRGLELEPFTLVASHHFAWIHIRAGLYNEAATQCRAAVELDPTFAMGRHWLGLALELQGLYQEALPELEMAERQAGNTAVSLELVRGYAVSGRIDDARRLLAQMHQKFEQSYAEPYGFAIAYAALGDVEQAFHWLECASQERSGWFAMWANGDPRLASLRGDPRMAELIRRMGIETARTASPR
jgi:pentatricopeptide repeat protein